MGDPALEGSVNFSGNQKVALDSIGLDKLSGFIKHDMRCWRSTSGCITKYTKKMVMEYLAKPDIHEKELRDVVRFIYIVSPHFRRIIQYFRGLSDLAYIVSPYMINTRTANVKTVGLNYRRTLDLLSKMSIRTQFQKILTVCIREDIFYGTIREWDNCIMVQPLPSDFCRISSVEDHVCNVAFDFRYFDKHPDLLSNYPEEFETKYRQYRDADRGLKAVGPWIELDSPLSFAVKSTDDILEYAIPPFAGILPEVFDIDTYKQMKLDKTDMDNYAMLAMKIPLENGEWGIDLDKAKDFWHNLDSVLPDRVGSVLTPMEIEKYSFEKTSASDADTVAEAEQNLFTAAGISSQLFNNAKPSANALLLSIKADQMITFGIVCSLQNVVNRYIHSKPFGKKFKVMFLDSSPYTRKEMGDSYIKAASYGMPTISMYGAVNGLEQEEVDTMSFLETKVLGLQDMFRQLVNSAHESAEAQSGEDAGAPQKDMEELSDSGEQSREDGDDW